METVLIPLHKPGAVSVCLSSQVGCAMACAFCATARMTTRRTLSTWEIVDQFVQARDFARSQGRRVTGAVFMGMGEPFLAGRHDRGHRRRRVCSDALMAPRSPPPRSRSAPSASSPRSTEYTAEGHRYRLSISLGAATDAKRAELVPVAAKWPIAEVMAAAHRHAIARRGRVMLSYVCISGVNVGEDDAEALGRVIGDTPVRLDLIDVTDPTGRFQPPTPEELNTFRDALTRHVGQPVARRYSGGKDIAAACGTLAGADPLPLVAIG